MNTIVINDQVTEQMCAARDRLVRARAEYDARLKETGSSHFSDTATLLRRQLRLAPLLADLDIISPGSSDLIYEVTAAIYRVKI